MPLKAALPKPHKPRTVSAALYRIPLPVTEIMVFLHGESYPVCPRCNCTIGREYMNYCDRCGQCLDWTAFDFARLVYAPNIR